jgi:hypothetical protein
VYERDSRRGFGLDIRFTDHLNTRLVTTLNYSLIADLHTLQITTAHAKSFPACRVFTISFLLTDSNNGYSSASVLKSSLNGGSLPTASSCSSCPPYNPKARTTVKKPFPAVSLLLHVACWRGNLFVCDRRLYTAVHATMCSGHGRHEICSILGGNHQLIHIILETTANISFHNNNKRSDCWYSCAYVRESIILKWILEKLGVRWWNGFNWLGMISNSGVCQHDHESQASKKAGDFMCNINFKQ